MNKKALFLVMLLLCSVYGYPESPAETEYLKTDHFIIRYNPEETPKAVQVAGLAESHYRKIEDFLNYSVRDDVHITVSWDDSLSGLSLFSKAIEINSVSDFSVEGNRLYKSLFMLFLRDMSIETSRFFPRGFTDEYIDEQLCTYSLKGFDSESELVLRSAFQNSNKSRFIVANIKNVNSREDAAVISGFFYFIESVYGKKILSRTVKERYYYGDFFNALSAVTGKTSDAINKEFNSFFIEKYPITAQQNIIPVMINPPGDYTISDFAVSPGGKTIVFLKNTKGQYSLEKIDLSTGNVSAVIKPSVGITFRNLCYRGDDQVCLAGNSRDGALIQIYNTDSFSKIKEHKLTGVFINSISIKDVNEIFFINSQSGICPVILSADFKNGVINRLYSGGLPCNSDVIYSGDRIYFVSPENRYELMEADKIKDVERSLVKLKDDITCISLSDNLITLSANSTAGGKIYTFNTDSGNFKEEAFFESPVYKAVISNSVIYCLTYYGGRYGIAAKPLSR